MLTIVESSTTISWATPRSARTAQRLGSAACVRAWGMRPGYKPEAASVDRLRLWRGQRPVARADEREPEAEPIQQAEQVVERRAVARDLGLRRAGRVLLAEDERDEADVGRRDRRLRGAAVALGV